MMFLVTSKPTPPTVFNLQAFDWVHFEEKTDAYSKLSLNIFKFDNCFLFLIFKVVYFAKKIGTFQKIP